jgi:hypothetical protein
MAFDYCYGVSHSFAFEFVPPLGVRSRDDLRGFAGLPDVQQPNPIEVYRHLSWDLRLRSFTRRTKPQPIDKHYETIRTAMQGVFDESGFGRLNIDNYCFKVFAKRLST